MRNTSRPQVFVPMAFVSWLSILGAASWAQAASETVKPAGEPVVNETDATENSLQATDDEQIVSETQSDAEASSDSGANNADDVELDEVLAGHSYHGVEFDEGPRQSARLMGGTGSVQFPAITHMPLVQQFINQGVGQLHGFWYYEAERSFRQAAALDPDCAIAYWGMAMANINNPERAKGFIEDASERKSKDISRERMWIEALHDLYHKEYNDDKAKWQAYVTAIEDIVHKFPDDIEAKAFLALHLFWGESGKALGVPSRAAVDSLLEQVFAVNPMHSAHHYRIHLWDDQKPERSLHSAARVGQAAPSIAHMWHMSGHIFSRLKRYEDASWQQEASSRVDHAYMIEDRVLPTEINNYTHNQEWFIRNLIKVGRIRDAIKLARNLVELPRHPRHNTAKSSDSAVVRGRTRLLDVLITFELWDELVELADTPYLDVDDATDARVRKLRYLGVAHAALGNQAQSDSQLAALREWLESEMEKVESEETEKEHQLVQKNAGENATDVEDPVRDEIDSKAASRIASDADKTAKSEEKAKEKARKKRIASIEDAIVHVRGQQAMSIGDAEEGVALFKEAGDLPKTALSRAHLEAGEPDQAIRLAKQAVESAKKECYPLACYAKTFYECGQLDESRREFERLRDLSASIDIDMSVFAELEPLAIEFGYGRQWFRRPVEREDVGERPPLDSLGPLTWQSSEAPQWSLSQPNGIPISLRSYRGTPVVVIFYLGFGCLHCVEQLEAFSPMAERYHDAGIELIAIGSEELPVMKKALETYRTEKELHIPLASNASLNVFKRYGCFDDFERMALHGTFLIDGAGRIRWSDIGYEPFTDARFLLGEAKRLLSLPSISDGRISVDRLTTPQSLYQGE